MLDVHTIIHPETPRSWVDQCMRSLKVAQDNAGFKVVLHVAPFIDRHIGKSRHIGYAMGDQPYVTCVDDDDWVNSDAFACLLEAMNSGHAAIYTRETQWQNGQPSTYDLRQHLRVFRRDVVDGFDFDPWPALDSTALIAHADTFSDSAELSDRVYHYRLRPESRAKRIMRATSGLKRRSLSLGENIHRANAHG